MFSRDLYYTDLDVLMKFDISPAKWYEMAKEFPSVQKYLRFPDHEFMAHYYLKETIEALRLPLKKRE